MNRLFQVGVLAATIAFAGTSPADAQSESTPLGSITLRRPVTANGEKLAAGTYTVRLTPEAPQPAVGQTAGAERWVEFVRGGKVAGKEVVTVVPDSEIAEIAEGSGRPAKGRYRVDTLKGGDYVRVWINRGGNNYLIHFPA